MQLNFISDSATVFQCRTNMFSNVNEIISDMVVFIRTEKNMCNSLFISSTSHKENSQVPVL